MDRAKLDRFLDRLAEKNKGSLTLAKDGSVLHSRSFGYRQIDGNEKKPLTAETKYRIASITKTFTAVMIFQLVEEEKLRLTPPPASGPKRTPGAGIKGACGSWATGASR